MTEAAGSGLWLIPSGGERTRWVGLHKRPCLPSDSRIGPSRKLMSENYLPV